MRAKWKLSIVVVLAVVAVHAYGLGIHLVVERLASSSGDSAVSHNPNVITRTIDGGVMTITLDGEVVTDSRSSIGNFNAGSDSDCPD